MPSIAASLPPPEGFSLNLVQKQLLELTSSVVSIGTMAGTEGQDFLRSAETDRIFGIDPHDRLNGQVLLQLVHPDDREGFERTLVETFRKRTAMYDVEMRIVRRDGVVRWVHAWGKNYWSSGASARQFIGGVMDVTDQKRAEEDWEILIAMLSHDMRLPITVISAHVQLLLRGADISGEKREMLGKVLSNIDRLSGMLDDFLELSTVRAGYKLSFNKHECDLRGVLEEALKQIKAVYGDRFIFKADGELGGSWAIGEIRRVFENLVTNAVKHGDPKAPIMIDLHRAPDRRAAILAVKNMGEPLSPEDQRLIVLPFNRGSKEAMGKTKGWGLGLAFARATAEALGTILKLQSDRENGTVFSIEIPNP